MDALFIALTVAVGIGYAWLPVRDVVCRLRRHKRGRARFTRLLPGGIAETEAVCMCAKRSTRTRTIVLSPKKEVPWDAPASATTPAPSPSLSE